MNKLGHCIDHRFVFTDSSSIAIALSIATRALFIV